MATAEHPTLAAQLLELLQEGDRTRDQLLSALHQHQAQILAPLTLPAELSRALQKLQAAGRCQCIGPIGRKLWRLRRSDAEQARVVSEGALRGIFEAARMLPAGTLITLPAGFSATLQAAGARVVTSIQEWPGEAPSVLLIAHLERDGIRYDTTQTQPATAEEVAQLRDRGRANTRYSYAMLEPGS